MSNDVISIITIKIKEYFNNSWMCALVSIQKVFENNSLWSMYKIYEIVCYNCNQSIHKQFLKRLSSIFLYSKWGFFREFLTIYKDKESTEGIIMK